MIEIIPWLGLVALGLSASLIIMGVILAAITPDRDSETDGGESA